MSYCIIYIPWCSDIDCCRATLPHYQDDLLRNHAVITPKKQLQYIVVQVTAVVFSCDNGYSLIPVSQ